MSSVMLWRMDASHQQQGEFTLFFRTDEHVKRWQESLIKEGWYTDAYLQDIDPEFVDRLMSPLVVWPVINTESICEMILNRQAKASQEAK